MTTLYYNIFKFHQDRTRFTRLLLSSFGSEKPPPWYTPELEDPIPPGPPGKKSFPTPSIMIFCLHNITSLRKLYLWIWCKLSCEFISTSKSISTHHQTSGTGGEGVFWVYSPQKFIRKTPFFQKLQFFSISYVNLTGFRFNWIKA